MKKNPLVFRARFKETENWILLSLEKKGDIFPGLVNIGNGEWMQEDGTIFDRLFMVIDLTYSDSRAQEK